MSAQDPGRVALLQHKLHVTRGRLGTGGGAAGLGAEAVITAGAEPDPGDGDVASWGGQQTTLGRTGIVDGIADAENWPNTTGLSQRQWHQTQYAAKQPQKYQPAQTAAQRHVLTLSRHEAGGKASAA